MTLCLVGVSMVAFAQPEVWKTLEKPLNFLLANDLGRNGYYDQKPIAELMGTLAEEVGIECVVAAGDVHHFEGVRSVNDPLPWYAILGNHEYRGNTQAPIDYTQVSARWNMPDRYYTKVVENDDVTVRLVMIDTSPLMDKYREDTEKYPDACKQDINKQLAWISERLDLQKRVDTILRKHANVDMYLCGHIHNFQHIRVPGSHLDYVVNTSGSLSRKVKPIEGTRFCSSETGFSLITADKQALNLHLINKEGKVLYTVKRTK